MLRRALAYWTADLHLAGSLVRWQVVMCIDSLGTGMMLPVTVLYFITVVHLPLPEVGAGLVIGGIAGTASMPFAGYFIDRFRPKTVIVTSYFIAGLAYFGFLAVNSWLAFVVVVSIAQVATSALMPANKSFAVAIAPTGDSVRVLAFQRSVRNVGYAVGGLVTGLLLALPDRTSAFREIVTVDAISFVAAALLTVTIHPIREAVSATATQADGYLQVIADRRYLVLGALNLLVLTHVTALNVALPVWIRYHTSAPLSMVGILFTVNAVIVVLLQVRLSKGVTHPSDAAAVYMRAAASFAAAGLAYLVSSWLGGATVLVVAALLVGIVAHTGAELWASIGEWVTSIQLAPVNLRGRYLALFSLSYPLSQAVLPGLVLLLMAWSATLVWPAMTLLLAFGCIATILIIRGAAEPNSSNANMPTSSGSAT